jgi:hypothetical protein
LTTGVNGDGGPEFRGLGLSEKRMNEEPSRPAIEVRYYSGYMADETPRALVAGGREYPVNKVLSRQRGRDAVTGESFDIFGLEVAGRKVVVKKAGSGRSEVLPASDLTFLERAG